MYPIYSSVTIYSVDTDREEVVLVTYGGCTTEQLADKVPEESTRYHLFRFKHTQGEWGSVHGANNKLVFIMFHQCSYTPCPGTLCLSRRE